MSKEELDGVWRTVRGRRIFIKKGESLGEAMSRSGKFSRDDVRESKQQSRRADRAEKTLQKPDNAKLRRKMTNKGNRYERDVFENKQAEKNRINENAKVNENAKTRVERNKEKYSYRDKQELKHEEVQKKLADYKAKKQSNNKQETEKELYERAKNHPETIDAMTENSTDWEALEKKYGKKEETFKQTSTNPFYEDREYNKEQLDKMAEKGIKPMKNSYSGQGWEGTKYDSNLSTKEIAKNISDYSKKEFPDVKLSRKTDYNSIDVHIMSSDKDLYATSKDIDKMSDNQVFDTIHQSIGGVSRLDDWLNKNNRKSKEGTYTTNDAREYLKEELNTYRNRKGDNVSGNEWYLSDYGKKVASGLNKEMNSYNFDDDDAYTDYFNSNFYGYVKIGKWDAPYQVNDTKAKVDAFKKRKGK